MRRREIVKFWEHVNLEGGVEEEFSTAVICCVAGR